MGMKYHCKNTYQKGKRKETEAKYGNRICKEKYYNKCTQETTKTWKRLEETRRWEFGFVMKKDRGIYQHNISTHNKNLTQTQKH